MPGLQEGAEQGQADEIGERRRVRRGGRRAGGRLRGGSSGDGCRAGLRFGLEELGEDPCQGNQVGDGSGDPHNGAGDGLVGEGGDSPEARHGRVVGIENAAGEAEDGREDRSLHAGKEEIRDEEPRGPGYAGGIGAEDGPPEDESADEHRGVLDVVPEGVAERQVVELRHVPEPDGHGEDDPRADRHYQPCEEGAQRFGTEEGGNPIAAKPGGKPGDEGQHRGREPEEHGGREHEEQVLDHVDRQQQVREGIQRRGDGHVKCDHGAEEAGGLADGELSGAAVPQAAPSAQIADGGKQGERRDGGAKRPGREKGDRSGIHVGDHSMREAGERAGGTPGGRSVWRKLTSVDVSAGLRRSPKGGMLPPPWMTWRMSPSRESRVAT